MSNWKPAGIGVWVREYAFRGNTVNSSAVALANGGLLVLSPGTEVPEADFAALDALGTVNALVAPGAFHNMGLSSWSERYPDAGLFGPTSAIAHIAKQHPKLKALQPPDALRPLLTDEFDLGEVEGCKQPDLFLSLKRGGETTWFTNELLTNNIDYPPNIVFSLLFKLFGDHPGVNVSSLACMFIGANKPKVRSYLESKLASVPPTRLVPCHGSLVEDPSLGKKLGDVLARRF